MKPTREELRLPNEQTDLQAELVSFQHFLTYTHHSEQGVASCSLFFKAHSGVDGILDLH
jgi:hypothetical protein